MVPDLGDVGGGAQADLDRLELHPRVECPDAGLCELDLAAADVGLRVEDLPVEVRELDAVEVDDAQVADAHGGEVERRVRADAAEAEQADAGVLEALLELMLARPQRGVRLEEAEVPRPALERVVVVEPVPRSVLEQAAAVEGAGPPPGGAPGGGGPAPPRPRGGRAPPPPAPAGGRGAAPAP